MAVVPRLPCSRDIGKPAQLVDEVGQRVVLLDVSSGLAIAGEVYRMRRTSARLGTVSGRPGMET